MDRYLYEVSDYDLSLRVIKTAFTACQDNRSSQYGSLCSTAGSCYYELNKLRASGEEYQKALEIRENEGNEDDTMLSDILHNLGNLESARGHYDEALEFFHRSREIRIRQGDLAASQLALSNLCIGRLHTLWGNNEEATKWLSQAELLFVRTLNTSKHYIAQYVSKVSPSMFLGFRASWD